jgi:prevent-host-death family protein
MPVETENSVSAEEFRREFDKYVAAAEGGTGPIAVTRNSQVLGFFIGAKEYETLVGAQVRKLLKERAKGPTVGHEEARTRIQKVLQRRARKR